MKLPSLKYADRIGKSRQIKFRGLNRSLGAGDGEIWDMQNMTSDHAPVLATRGKRRLYRKLEKPGGIYAWNRLCWVDGTSFYYDGEAKGQVSEGQKTFSSLGAYIVIFPDKCYYNVETDTFGSMEAKWSGAKAKFTNGLLYGEEADANTLQSTGVDWETLFRVGDAVTITGCTKHPENNKTAIIRAIDGDKLYFYEFTFALDNGAGYEEAGALTVERTVPDLKYICENESRLWGCTDTTIYACKWQDIFNWNVYDGLESDAWAVTPGSAGIFTGCVAYKGYTVCFKESRIHKIYGSTPSTFTAVDSASLGLAEGSENCFGIAGETLFYLGNNGIMAYSGGIPQPACEGFGLQHFRNAVGGSDGLKYYVSMQGDDGSWWLYVYDTQRGMWHKEDQTQATHFAGWDGNLYMLNDKGEIWMMGNPIDLPEGTEAEADVEWWVEFTDFTEDDPNKKGVSKLQLRLELEEEAELEIFLQFDSDGVWHCVKHLVGEGQKRSYYIPIIPRRCDHYRMKLVGTGACRVHSLVREVYSGSELKSTYGRN